MRLDEIKLKEQVSLQGWTQAILSRNSCVSCATISKIYNGGSCSAETAFKIAKALGVEVKTLVKE